MIVTGSIQIEIDLRIPVRATKWLVAAEIPELEEWAQVAAGVYLAGLANWRLDVTDVEDARQLLLHPEAWHEQAVCRTRDPKRLVDPYWFGTDGLAGPVLPPEFVAIAKAHCDVCPVRVACLHWALTNNERFGVWGGMSARRRDGIRRSLIQGTTTLREVFAEL